MTATEILAVTAVSGQYLRSPRSLSVSPRTWTKRRSSVNRSISATARPGGGSGPGVPARPRRGGGT